MKLACFVMFRNEAAILGPFLDQLQTFFDHSILADHGSTDGGAEMVRARGDSRLELLRLQAPGYPQSELATVMTRRILDTHDPDFLFLLDCDEFLPFADRAALEAFLAAYKEREVLLLPWQQICPESLEGGDIFAGRFLRAAGHSRFAKIVLTRRIKAHQGWRIAHGYREVNADAPLDVAGDTGSALLHMPVQSRSQFRFKVAAGARRLNADSRLRGTTLGEHWRHLDRLAAQGRLDAETLRGTALHYPHVPDGPVDAVPLEFGFPYVRSAYAETAAALSGRLDGLLQELDAPEAPDVGAFVVLDEAGEVVLTSGAFAANSATPAVPAITGRSLPEGLFLDAFAEDYAALVEPMFNLPAKVPSTTWAGHLPFLFPLFRTLRPATYVGLGVRNGASLIGAATAARTYGLDTHCAGVDTWQGDEHAGRYEGHAIYETLRGFVSHAFPNVTLMRCLSSEARRSFRPGSVDILHIDGLHTYDAVKEDFTTWFDAMSPEGVILFHDICVHERGFGVHRLWDELKRHFPTIEFHHWFGLGVLFLAPEGERFAPFRRLMQDGRAMQAYRSIAANVGDTLLERMAAYEPAPAAAPTPAVSEEAVTAPLRAELADRQAEVEALRRTIAERDALLTDFRLSTSWRLTKPLRAVSRILRR